jgi:hypothetical protein
LGGTSNLSHIKDSLRRHIDLETIFNTEFAGMVIIYIYTKIRTHNSNSSLFIAIKPKAKNTRIFLAASNLLPYILQKETT